MLLLITGGRNFEDSQLVNRFLSKLHSRRPISLLIHGGANGADTLAGKWAAENGVAVEVHLADWRNEGRSAGPKRNQRMIERKPDLVIAFPLRIRVRFQLVDRVFEVLARLWWLVFFCPFLKINTKWSESEATCYRFTKSYLESKIL
jgi:hypothetical protein